MANYIELIQKYVPLLDAKYAAEAKSSVLDVQSDLIRETANAKSVLIPKMVLQGLGDYDRSSGFVKGNATLEWVTHTFSMDRGRTFMIDAMDNEETAMVAFASLSGEFIRTQVAPEIDAYRFSTYTNYVLKAGGNYVEELVSEDNIITAIDTAIGTLDDAEVPEGDRVLFVSVPTYNLMKNSTELAKRFDVQTGSGNVDRRIETIDGMQVIKVPSARFKTAYVFNDGKTAGQENGGFTPDINAMPINFMIVSKSAVVQIVKLALPRVFTPEENQEAHAWKFDYRLYHDAWVLDNKKDGIYVSVQP